MDRNLSHLRLTDLQLLISAAKLENLGQAAKQHHLSQSAASTAIQRVENAFGQKLCTHEKRQFALRPDCISLIHRAEKWLLQFQHEVLATTPEPIRLVTTHAISKTIITDILLNQSIYLKLMRPDNAYRALLQDKADLAIVPGNAPWRQVHAIEIATGFFQLYSKADITEPKPVLLPEDQIEVLDLKQKWQQQYNANIPIKACIPSWSLIADICCRSNCIGFLPDFLTLNTQLKAVTWQPEPSEYNLLALYKPHNASLMPAIQTIINYCKTVFTNDHTP